MKSNWLEFWGSYHIIHEIYTLRNSVYIDENQVTICDKMFLEALKKLKINVINLIEEKINQPNG